MNGREKLEQLLAEITEAKRMGFIAGAEALGRWTELAKDALVGEGTWISEARAVKRSKHTVRWFAQRYPTWEALGYARTRDRRREYHEAVIPIAPARVDVEDPEEQARKDEAA
jgi:hypothetical protein